ncbi:Clp protease N-terminal domain-containing protein [Rhodococcus sp. ZPP]|uniref:Clp protease N-terminal domain-containing protein n=1 Tax=Rhodococcus sp. ZPP TaxID=2749906 RepID=UPI001FCD1F07|nr:Clp protease N-terminal domain-containing protein [Rhodococcus sp. ZPP]
MLSINNFQNGSQPDETGTRAPPTPRRRHSPRTSPNPTSQTGTCHHSRSQHHYAQGCRGHVDPTHNHLHTAQNGQQRFSSGSRRSRRRLGRERVVVFERFSDQARQVVVLAAGAARTHHQNWRRHRTPAGRDLRRRRSRSSSTDLVGCHRPPAKTKKVLEGSLRQTALLGHEEIGTDHLLLALLDDPASTGAEDPHRPCNLSIGEMREHLRRELAQQPTPGGPAHRIPIRLSDDEYTRAHTAARTAGQNLETWIGDRQKNPGSRPADTPSEIRQPFPDPDRPTRNPRTASGEASSATRQRSPSYRREVRRPTPC